MTDKEYIIVLEKRIRNYDKVLQDLSRNRGCLLIREYVENKLQELRNE